MSDVMLTDSLERLLAHLEQEILAAPDSDLLADEPQRRAGATARTLAAAALADRARRTARRNIRSAPRPSVDGRAAVRQLLVASPRARDLAGRARVDSLSDTEVEAILARFIAAGLLPPVEDKE